MSAQTTPVFDPSMEELLSAVDEFAAEPHGHPVYLIHDSRHMGVANTRAFKIAGYPERRDVPVPAGRPPGSRPRHPLPRQAG